MFVSSDRTLLATDSESLTSADSQLLVAAKGPRPQTAVTSRKHLSPSWPLNAVESGEQSRSVLTNVATSPKFCASDSQPCRIVTSGSLPQQAGWRTTRIPVLHGH
jgi:hypothetical protein